MTETILMVTLISALGGLVAVFLQILLAVLQITHETIKIIQTITKN
jgi:ABC-type phosphate/phosphonate transport system permease subunit